MFATLLLCAPLVWLAWKVLRLYLTRSPLDNVPGPPRASWLAGTLTITSIVFLAVDHLFQATLNNSLIYTTGSI